MSNSWCEKQLKELKKEKKPKRKKLWLKQFKNRGWTDKELWNLDVSFAKWILPRLVEFKKQTMSYPPKFKNESEWAKVLQTMIDGFTIMADENIYFSLPRTEKDKKFKKIKLSMSLFYNHIYDLWS